MEPTTDDLPLPARIGRYEILARVGEGGMGTVYRARDGELGRVVALKVPRFHGPAAEQARQAARFRREARAAARVWHPGVCPIFDVGEHEGRPFVVMAFVEGESLAQRLARRGRFEDVGAAVGVAVQVLEALAAIHAAGITHRDVKPGNVLLDATGRAVLTDFGLARPEEDAEPLTSEGMIVGTPSYMAPEQAAAAAESIGPRTDLYAVGVVLFEMLTGRRPFEGPTLAVLRQIAHEEPPALGRLRPEVDAGIEAAVMQSLRKDPGDRPADALAFAAALRGGLAGPPGAGEPAPPVAAEPTAPTRPVPVEATAAVPGPARPRRQVMRRLGWLVGDVPVMLAAAVWSIFPWTYFQKAAAPSPYVQIDTGPEIVPFLGVSVLCGIAVLAGLGLWSLVEYFHVPEGLFSMVRNGQTASARAALAAGVPVDCRDEFGDTPLIKAAAAGNLDMVKLLLGHGADTGVQNRAGQTARDAAMAGGRHDVAALLDLRGTPAAPRPGPEAVRAPRWAWRAPMVAAAGVLLVLAFAFLWYPHPVSRATLEVMTASGDVARLEQRGGIVLAEKKDPQALDRLRLTSGNGWVWAPVGRGATEMVRAAKAGQPGLQTLERTSYLSHPVGLCPTLLEAVAIAAFPVALISLIFCPLIRLRAAFPMLNPRRAA